MGDFNSAWFISVGIGVLVELLTATSLPPQWAWGLRIVGTVFLLVGLVGLGVDFHTAYELRLPFVSRQGPDLGQPQLIKWKYPESPTSIIGEAFRNTEVKLDGYSYDHCTFENVTFVYNGTAAPHFTGNTVNGFTLRSDNDAVNGTLQLMKGFGYLREGIDFRLTGQHSVVEEPNFIYPKRE